MKILLHRSTDNRLFLDIIACGDYNQMEQIVTKTNTAYTYNRHPLKCCKRTSTAKWNFRCAYTSAVVTFIGEREFVDTSLSEDVQMPGLPDTAGASRGEADVVHLVVLHALRPQRRQRARAADHHHLCVANGFDFL